MWYASASYGQCVVVMRGISCYAGRQCTPRRPTAAVATSAGATAYARRYNGRHAAATLQQPPEMPTQQSRQKRTADVDSEGTGIHGAATGTTGGRLSFGNRRTRGRIGYPLVTDVTVGRRYVSAMNV